MRCLTLAKRLVHSGWSCSFAVSTETLSTVHALGRSGFEVLTIPADAEAEELSEAVNGRVDLMTVDHYALERRFEAGCYAFADKILVLDDLANRPHDCDYLLDTTPDREPYAYAKLTPEKCALFMGPDYALLREKFATLRSEARKRLEKGLDVSRILVSFGLTDPAGATAEAVQGVLAARTGASVDVVLSPHAPKFKEVSRLAAERPEIQLLEYAEDMPGLMVAADLAIGAAGTTSWERCCLGLPAVVVVLADNQEPIARWLEKTGAAVNLGRSEDVGMGEIAQAVSDLVNDAAARRAMSKIAAGLCDGKGAVRVALALHPETVARDGGAVGLRLARESDRETMFRWQSHPETRRFARNPEPPSRKEHEAWYARTMADPNRELYVITHRCRDAGLLRLDRIGDVAMEVSIVAAPEIRGLGVGGAALLFAGTFHPNVDLHAEVLPGNEPSKRMFLAAGYEPVGGTLYVRRAAGKGRKGEACDPQFP